MPFDRFLIAPFATGLQKNARPWLIMDDAFEYIQNAYVFRGRVRKRFGSLLMGTLGQASSRLRVSLGNNTNAAMNLPANTTTHTPQLAIGQTFTLGSDLFNVYQLGAGVATRSTNPAVSAVINSTVNPNTITFTGGALTDVNWYPSLPVMGITQYLSGSVNDHPTYAFDTEFAYTFNSGAQAWQRSGTAVWQGNDLNFFWATNWEGVDGTIVMFVTNFNATTGAGKPAATDDPIWSFDGTTWTAHPGSGANGFFFLPAGGARTASPFIQTARIIVAYKNRLVLLNTIENDNSGGGGTGVATAYVNRARYSIIGSPFANNAWYEQNQTDAAGAKWQGAGFEDASTDEAIISAQFIKDRLIVYFERSTWELAYVGDTTRPFQWNRLNNELGSQGTFSTVPFDKIILTIGQTGVHACNGSNVQRIDDKIPDEVFEFRLDNNEPQRIAGIRDYYTEMVYWTFVSDFDTATQNYPNQVLVYNYKNDSWALNDDCFTAFGYFEQQTGETWATLDDITWAEWNSTWASTGNLQANERQILGGTPEGWVLRIAPDFSRNAPSIQITNMVANGDGTITITAINHNLSEVQVEIAPDNDFVLIENVVGDANAQSLNGNIFSVTLVPTSNTFLINTVGHPFISPIASLTYNGGGTAARVSNVVIKTKQWNPYVDQDRNIYLQRIDFGVQRTVSGQITVDYFPSATSVSMIQGGQGTGTIMGNSILETTAYNPALYPLEVFQDRLWHPIYFQTTGECIQLYMYFNLLQMQSPDICLDDFQLEGMALYVTPTSSRLQ